jgi:hypothetical protein
MLTVVLLTLSHPLVATAQEAPEPTTEHTYAFAQHVTITLALPSDVETEEVTLFLRTSQQATEPHTIVPEDGLAQYKRELREHPLPPFTEITYWWTYESASGEDKSTAATTFLYKDNRFAWERLEEPQGEITLYWVNGSTELMTTGLDIARTALDKMDAHLKRLGTEEVQIYIYPTQPNLEQAMRLSGTAWVAGEAHPEVGVILVAIPPNDQATSKMKTLLPHEITHLVLYRHLGAEGYANLPSWLNEGLASYFEQRPDPAYTIALDNAESTNSWLALERLCDPFYQMASDQVTLAYAESHSVTRYLVEAYGWSGMRTLLSAYADGLNCTRGLENAIGIDLPTLEREWKVWLGQDGQVTPSQQRAWAMAQVRLRDIAPWLALALLMIVPGVLMALTPHTPRALS